MQYPQIGMRVLVPLAKKEIVGIVYREHTEPVDATIKVRDIICTLDLEPFVTQEQLRLWNWIAEYYMCTLGDVMTAALPAKANDRQYSLDVQKRRVKLPVYSDETVTINTLNEQQTHALDSIHRQWQENETVLLYGVTSSGKTEVYIHLIEEQLSQGKQVLYLVPEIALTTQLTDRLSRIFGNRIFVYHSRVSDGQRMEMYRRLLTETDKPLLILSARSGVFLPLHNLGLVIVDEEHEPSYKQAEPAPRYHARSVATMIAKMAGAKVLLGTATPSVETYYNATTGKFGLTVMPERYQGLELPSIKLIDLNRQYHRKEMYGHFSDPLVERIREELDKGKQVILFQNRRGYAPMLLCKDCGKPPRCPDCDAALTVHLRDRLLRCHYCGHSEAIPTACPQCGGELTIRGFGTERLEDEVRGLFPEARIARMDLDTTQKKNDYQDIIDHFSRHEVDILIGTQMVTKGLHFDDVSLVGVLSADHILNQPSFRSYERAYQLLEQVAGRAGRKGDKGEIIIQTWDPKNPLFDILREHNYERLFAEQLQERQAFNYPPFHRLISIILRHTDLRRLESASKILRDRLAASFGERCTQVIVPAVARVQKYHIRHIRVRIEVGSSPIVAKRIIREHINYVEKLTSCKGVKIMPDVDPM
jgi:primosomal protein N' (replication factor Y)